MFEVGEIAVVHAPGHWSHGRECEIVSIPRGFVWRNSHGRLVPGDRYRVRIPGCIGPQGHDVYAVREQHLRKRRPPIPEEVLQIFQRRVVTA